MPARLDRVNVATSRGTIEIPWSSRDALLRRVANIGAAQHIREELAAVGASRPAHFNRSDIELLIKAIHGWSEHVGAQKLPPGIWGLYNTLVDDLKETRDQ